MTTNGFPIYDPGISEEMMERALADGLCGVYTMTASDDAELCLDAAAGHCSQCGKPYCRAHEGGERGACVECVER